MNRRRQNVPLSRLRAGPNRSRRQRSTNNIFNTPRSFDIEKGETQAIAFQQSRPIRIPKLVFAPDSVIVDLVFPDTLFVKNNVGSASLSWRYRMNSIFDPDPTLGSGSVPGYTFWSGAYSSYRVLAFSYSVQLMNLESSPIDVVAAPSLSDLGANYSFTSELFGNPHATVSALSAKGGMDRALLKGHIDLGKYYGNSTQYLGNDSFGSGFGSNPAGIMHINIGAVSAGLFTTNNGVDYRATLTYTVLLTQRKIVVA
jgi:hypothetical protein